MNKTAHVNFTCTSANSTGIFYIEKVHLHLVHWEVIIMCPGINNRVSPALKNIHEAFKALLMKDFSEPLATWIIWRNCRDNCLQSEFRAYGYEKLINSIASDYAAINPVGRIKDAQLKEDLRAALNKTVP